MMRSVRTVAFLVGLTLVAAACGDDGDDGAADKPKVAVSIFPLYDIARRVAGDRLDVVLVLPPGRSEHGFEPTPQQMAAVSGADLGLLVGLEMDPWAERIVNAAAEDARIVELGPAVDPRRLSAPEVGVDVLEHAREHREHAGERHEAGEHHEESEHHEGEGGEHDEAGEHHEGEGEEHDEAGEHHEGGGRHEEGGSVHEDEHVHEDEDDDGDRAGGEREEASHAGHHHHHGAHDPHFWLDPVRMISAVDRMVEAFSELDPAGAEGFRERGERVKTELRALHERIEQQLSGIENRTIVTFHGSFGYFAERYGLRVAAVIEPFPGREPTPRYMQEVIGAIRASGAPALFSEPQLDPRPARVIAQQAGVALHSVDPVGGTAGVDTYERLLEHDAEVFARALRGGR